MIEFYPEGWLINTEENKNFLSSSSNLIEAQRIEKILEAKATVCDSEHNLIVDLGCMKGIIPRTEGAIGIREGTIRDIAVISKVNKPICFVVTGFDKDENGKLFAKLSRRKAQEICMDNYIMDLIPGDVIKAKVTHMEPFGTFTDIGCGIISFLPIDSISISRINHPKERFSIGTDIKVIVKTNENGRINLTHKELLGTWQENANQFSIGETVAGIIRSVEDYGVFVELTPNLAGLAELKEGVVPGHQASVYIKNIIPEKMKVKLVIIDTFDYSSPPPVPTYFFDQSHMDCFTYSPSDCNKIIKTDFNNQF